MRNGSKSLKVWLLVAGLMLCGAVIPTLPYGFYVLLRWIVCGVSAYAAMKLKENPSLGRHFIPLLLVAVLFNPFLPVSLTPLIWLLIDLAGAIYFLQLAKRIE